MEVFGKLDVGLIKLYGSTEYYIKKISGYQISIAPSEKSRTGANDAQLLDSCIGNNGWQDAPNINLGEVYTSNLCLFSGGKMFKQIYRVFNMPNAGKINCKGYESP